MAKHEHSRNEIECKRYFAQCRWARNKKLRLKRHIAKHPDDKTATVALKNLPTQRRGRENG
jgi:ribosomal protein S15P/S13E